MQINNTPIIHGISTPSIVVLEIPEVFNLIDNFIFIDLSQSGNFQSNISLRNYYRNDYRNIIMDLFECISEDPSNVFAKVNIDILSFSDTIKDNSSITDNFINLCNNCKSIIIDKIISLNFNDIIKKDKQFFNFYVKEISCNSVILKHLKS